MSGILLSDFKSLLCLLSSMASNQGFLKPLCCKLSVYLDKLLDFQLNNILIIPSTFSLLFFLNSI